MSSEDILLDSKGNHFARSGVYRIYRVAERFPDLSAAVDYHEKFLQLDEVVQNRLLAYCRIREAEEAALLMRGMM